MIAIIIPILVGVIIASILLLIFILRAGSQSSSTYNDKGNENETDNGQGNGSGEKKTKKHSKNKNPAIIIRDCTRKLQKNPRDIPALTQLAAVYFGMQDWEKALPLYTKLYEISSAHEEIDKTTFVFRQGICLYKTGNFDEAAKSIAVAHNTLPDDMDTNFYFGCTLYELGDYERAIACLNKVKLISPETTAVNAPLGFAYYKLHKYKECLPFLRNVLNDEPENKEVLFNMACAMTETGHADKAFKVFMHLRPDPKFGPQSCLEVSKVHIKQKQYEAAIQDFEIGLKIENVPPEIAAQLRYNLATVYISTNNISKALTQLKQVQSIAPNYKDVNALIARYTELNQNSNLQTYLLGSTSDFVILCRKFVNSFYKNASIKIEDVSVQAEYVEITCNVDSAKWEGKEMFRFYRTQGSTGELYVRDFHSKLRDSKSDRGYIITAGDFSAEAKKYTEGRPIDLLEKNKLTAKLQQI